MIRNCIILYDTRLLYNCYDLVIYVYSRRDRAMMYDARPLVENSRLENLGGGRSPPHPPSHPPCDPLTFPQWQQPGVFYPSGSKFVSFDQSLICHALQQDCQTGSGIVRNPQGSVDVDRTETVLGNAVVSVVHGKD